MDKELAKTLTTALVQFIDNERPEWSMCCSNSECLNLETAFCAENFGYIEAFIKRKFTGLTVFEQASLKRVFHQKPDNVDKENELAKKHLEGYIMGREDTLREMKDFIESHFNAQSGTSAATLHGNTSATDGKEHNPSFTDQKRRDSMTIYYIAISSWDGRAYTFSYNRLFLTEQERDKALMKMKEGKSFKDADIILDTGEEEVEDTLKEEG